MMCNPNFQVFVGVLSNQDLKIGNAFLTLVLICVYVSLQHVQFKGCFNQNLIDFAHINILLQYLM
jgi:hypothetical protein